MIRVVALLGILTATAGVARAEFKPGAVVNFSLLDYSGQQHELRRADAPIVVLYFTSFSCPIARQSVAKLQALQTKFASRGVLVWMVNATPYDEPDDAAIQVIGQLAASGKLNGHIPKSVPGSGAAASQVEALQKMADLMPRSLILGDPQVFKHQVLRALIGSLPVLRDEHQLVSQHFGVVRTCEAIVIDVKNSTILYRGAVDDQLTEGAKKPKAQHHYLADALTEALDGKPVTTPKTPVHGCLISYEREFSDEPTSYAKQVAPILLDKCVDCHRPGRIGPFSLDSYKTVRGWSAMIQETVLDRRMPPWHADPHYGKFANDRSLTGPEARTLLRWIEQGCPRGEGDDPLAVARPEPAKWTLGDPDFVVSLPGEQEIPATGTLDYRYLNPEFVMPRDASLRAAVVRPGNPQVVHHIIVRVKYPPGYRHAPEEAYLFTTWAPGIPQAACPSGTEMFLPKGARFNFEVHYTTNGTPQTDLSEMGLYLADEPAPMRLEVRACETRDLQIPPGERDAKHTCFYCFKREAMIFEFGPHMHLRGSWFKFEALYPNGNRETLLSVPRYDFNWQSGYRLAEPKRVPAGTWIMCIGGFDNSGRNPHNPDPTKRVNWGLQTWDEMFMGFLTVADVPREPTKEAE